MPLKSVIGDARIVGIGEVIHTAHEHTELKVRVFEFLVREMGFTAFAMESGLTDGKLVYDYVLGADIDRDKVLWEGFSYGFGCSP
jgi:erythromycin esterase-like protein